MSDFFFQVKLPYPPSANRNWGYGARNVYLQKGVRQFREAVAWRLVEARAKDVPKCKFYGVEVVLFPADNRLRDDDNGIKPLWDAITKSGQLWNDDSQVIEHRVRRGLPAEEPFIVLSVWSADEIILPDPDYYGGKRRTYKRKPKTR